MMILFTLTDSGDNQASPLLTIPTNEAGSG